MFFVGQKEETGFHMCKSKNQVSTIKTFSIKIHVDMLWD